MINWINLSQLSNYPTWQWQVTCISMVLTVKSLSRLIVRGYQGCKGPGPWMLTEACQSCIESQIGQGVDPPSERTIEGGTLPFSIGSSGNDQKTSGGNFWVKLIEGFINQRTLDTTGVGLRSNCIDNKFRWELRVVGSNSLPWDLFSGELYLWMRLKLVPTTYNGNWSKRDTGKALKAVMEPKASYLHYTNDLANPCFGSSC